MPTKPLKTPGPRALGPDGKPIGILATDGIGIKPGGELIPTVVPSVILAPVRAADSLKGRARVEALIAEVHAIKASVSANWHRLGVILNELARNETLSDIECESFTKLLQHYELMPRLNAFRYMSLASTFTEEEVSEIGTEKGLALIRYAKASGGKTEPAALLRGNAKIAGHLVRDHTVATLRSAVTTIHSRRREREEASDDTVEEANTAVRKLGAAMRRNGARGATAKRVRRNGVFLVRVELDPDEAVALAASLTAR